MNVVLKLNLEIWLSDMVDISTAQLRGFSDQLSYLINRIMN